MFDLATAVIRMSIPGIKPGSQCGKPVLYQQQKTERSIQTIKDTISIPRTRESMSRFPVNRLARIP